MCFIERETQNLPKIYGNFLMKRNSAQAHEMKSDEKLFSVKSMQFFKEKMVHVVIDRCFSYTSEDFSYPKAISDSPFKGALDKYNIYLFIANSIEDFT